MPIADMLINEASGHRVISFLDVNAGYNQIFMAEEDTSKTSFRCPDFVGLFEWVVMTFGLKNAGATYCWYFLTLTEKSASTQKYRCSTSPGSIQGIIISTRNGGVTVF